MIEMVRKKWILIWYLNVDNCTPDTVSVFLEQAKKILVSKEVDDFFGSKPLTFFVPVRDIPSRMEVHEIVLDAVGYDKYETIIQNKNLNVQDALDQLKELLDVEEREV